LLQFLKDFKLRHLHRELGNNNLDQNQGNQDLIWFSSILNRKVKAVIMVYRLEDKDKEAILMTKTINLEINLVLQLDKIQNMETLWWASNKVNKNKQLPGHRVEQFCKDQIIKKLKAKDL